MILALRTGASCASWSLFRNGRRFPPLLKFLLLHGAGLTLTAQMPYYAALVAILLMTLGFVVLQLHKGKAKLSSSSSPGKNRIFLRRNAVRTGLLATNAVSIKETTNEHPLHPTLPGGQVLSAQ